MSDNSISHLEWRYAVRKFDSSKKIPDNEFDSLMESLRLAPSSFGLQPWKFVIVKDQNLRNSLVKYTYNQAQVAEASHLIVLCVPKSIDESYVKSFINDTASVRNIPVESLSTYEKMIVGFIKSLSLEILSHWMKYQVYIALGMLLSECAHRKIDSAPLEGFDSKKYDEILNLDKDGLKSVVLCTVGYRSSDDHYSNAKKVRFPKDKVFLYK